MPLFSASGSRHWSAARSSSFDPAGGSPNPLGSHTLCVRLDEGAGQPDGQFAATGGRTDPPAVRGAWQAEHAICRSTRLQRRAVLAAPSGMQTECHPARGAGDARLSAGTWRARQRRKSSCCQAMVSSSESRQRLEESGPPHPLVCGRAIPDADANDESRVGRGVHRSRWCAARYQKPDGCSLSARPAFCFLGGWFGVWVSGGLVTGCLVSGEWCITQRVHSKCVRRHFSFCVRPCGFRI